MPLICINLWGNLVDKKLKMAPSTNAIPIFGSYKKNRVEAQFYPSTNEVFYDNKLFMNPTAASKAAIIKNGAGKHVSINGWSFWKYLDHEGGVRELSEIRNNH